MLAKTTPSFIARLFKNSPVGFFEKPKRVSPRRFLPECTGTLPKIRSGHPGSPFNGIVAARILSFLCYKLVHSGKNL